MPDVLHQSNGFLKHGLLEAKEVVNVKGHTWRARSSRDGLLAVLVLTFGIAFFDNLSQVGKVTQLELAELLPPVGKLAHHDVIGDQTEFDLGLSLGLTHMSALVVGDGIATEVCLPLCCSHDLMWQRQDMQALAFIWGSQNVLHDSGFHRSNVVLEHIMEEQFDLDGISA